MSQQSLTIGDIAEAMGMSKTTVSRAISGKGRVSEETRAKVLAYIRQHNYRPNAVARGLAQNRTYNIALVISRKFSSFDLSFVRRSMTAVCDTAAQNDYDVLLTIADQEHPDALARLIENGKTDGVLLTSAIEDSSLTEMLRARRMPFAVVGSLSDKTILQVDNDQVSGCRELTSLLIKLGCRRIALLGGSHRYTVNCSRLAGYEEAFRREGLPIERSLIFMDLETLPAQLSALDQALDRRPDCLLCMDDLLSLTVLKELKKRCIRVPEDIRLASMYDCEALEECEPGITAVQFDATTLARTACQLLIDSIMGRPTVVLQPLGYQLVVRRSTG